MRLNTTITAKLMIAYSLFLIPIAFLGYQMVSDKTARIAFARKEIQGAHYIMDVRGVQDAVVRGALLTGMAGRIRGNERALGADLKTAAAAEALAKALEGTDRGLAAQAAADLIGKAADGSNLTLDPDLDSFYTQDALTVKVPAAVAGLEALASAAANNAGGDVSVANQVAVGVQVGTLQSALDGLASDIDSAVEGNPDKSVARSVSSLVAAVTQTSKQVLPALADPGKAADAHAATRPLLDALIAVGTADAGEVEHLLNERISGLSAAEMTNAAVASMLFLMAVLYAFAVVQRGAIDPLRGLTSSMLRLAEHDVTVEIGGLSRNDEVGSMARAVQVFRDNMIEADALTAARAGEQELRERRRAAMEQHTQDFGTSISGVMTSLASAAEGMRQAATAMSRTANAVHVQAAGTAEEANRSSQDLTSVAAAVEQMTASIAEIARQVAAAAEVAREAVSQAETGRGTIKLLADSMSRVENVVGLIADIAGQTNLLALNATIEAARAGEAGKGFAVVAGEVKALAGQTTRATAEISGQIGAIQSATTNAVAIMDTIGTVIGRMEHVSAAIAAAVEEQSVTTREIAASVQAVTGAIGGVSHAMNEVVGNTDESEKVGRTVTAGADEIASQANMLRVEVDEFLTAVQIDDAEKRRYMRIAGNGTTVTIETAGQPARQARIQDISRSGMALESGWASAAGVEARITFPGDRTVLSGRVARTGVGIVAIVFRQDNATIAEVDRIIDSIKARRAA